MGGYHWRHQAAPVTRPKHRSLLIRVYPRIVVVTEVTFRYGAQREREVTGNAFAIPQHQCGKQHASRKTLT